MFLKVQQRNDIDIFMSLDRCEESFKHSRHLVRFHGLNHGLMRARALAVFAKVKGRL